MRGRSFKGSLTVEASVIISLFIVIMGITMNMAIVLYKEVSTEQEQNRRSELWAVEYFYKVKGVGELVNDK